jgi:hypothetical protein
VRTPRRNGQQSRIGHSWLHAWPAPASTITRRPQVLRLSPDGARTYFYIPENGESTKQARAAWRASRPYVVRLRILQGDEYVIPCWEASSVPAGKRRKFKRLLEKERDGTIDFMAEAMEDEFWDVLTAHWAVTDLGNFAALAEMLSDFQEELKRCLIGDPATAAGAILGLTPLGTLAEHVPIPGIDRSFSEIRQYAELAGIVLVVLAGGHILACASFKLWVHDKLGEVLAKAIDKFLRELGAEPFERSRPTYRDSSDRSPREGPDQPPRRPPPREGSSGSDGPEQPPPSSGASPPAATPRKSDRREHASADPRPTRSSLTPALYTSSGQERPRRTRVRGGSVTHVLPPGSSGGTVEPGADLEPGSRAPSRPQPGSGEQATSQNTQNRFTSSGQERPRRTRVRGGSVTHVLPPGSSGGTVQPGADLEPGSRAPSRPQPGRTSKAAVSTPSTSRGRPRFEARPPYEEPPRPAEPPLTAEPPMVTSPRSAPSSRGSRPSRETGRGGR